MVLLAMCFTIAMAGTAMAQDNPTEDAYGGALGEEVQDDSAPPPPAEEREVAASTPPVATQSTGSLPFTGFESGLIALVGIGLVALGVAMRRSTRRAHE